MSYFESRYLIKSKDFIDAYKSLYAIGKDVKYVVDSGSEDGFKLRQNSENKWEVIPVGEDSFLMSLLVLFSDITNTVLMHAYIYYEEDQSVWAYSLFNAGELVDEFCTDPFVFDWVEENHTKKEKEKIAEQYKGNLSLISALYGVSEGRVSQYILQQDRSLAGQIDRHNVKAYPSDRSCYGNSRQIHDFINSLGYDYPSCQKYDREMIKTKYKAGLDFAKK